MSPSASEARRTLLVIGDGDEGAVTRKLRETLGAIHAGESELHPEWLHHVSPEVLAG